MKPIMVNVTDAPYFAKGDGVADDGPAIQRALDDVGHAGGGQVAVPAGKYRIGTHLVVPAHTSLVGVFLAPPTWPAQGTVLQAYEGKGNEAGTPFITLGGANATLKGLAVYYPEQIKANPPLKYPWTIRAGAGADHASVVDVLLVNAWNGIDLATNQTSRHYIRGVYGQPLHVGIVVDRCHDIGRIQDVHFWPFWTFAPSPVVDFQLASATAFVFRTTDWEVVEDIFCWGYRVGARFEKGQTNGMNGQMSNVNFDNVMVGLDVACTQPYAVHVTNLNVASPASTRVAYGIHGNAGANGDLTVTNASFWGPGIKQALRWECAGVVSLSFARIIDWDGAAGAVEILLSRAMIQHCYFRDVVGTAVKVGPGADRVMIVGNELVGNHIQDQGPRTLVASNHP